MGIYFQPGDRAFAAACASGYVDKTGLLAYINGKLGTWSKLLCAAQPRGFGKTVTAGMIAAYYDNSVDTKNLFRKYKIAQDPSYEKHINKYNVVSWNVADFCVNLADRLVFDREKNTMRPAAPDDIVLLMRQTLRSELLEVYPNAGNQDSSLADVLYKVCVQTGVPFYFVIDEWDALDRLYPGNHALHMQYMHLLRELFSSAISPRVIAGAYVTGILPMMRMEIGPGAADFFEVSMISPAPLQAYFGFTEAEARQVLSVFGVSFEKAVLCLESYPLDGLHIYNPVSARRAVEKGKPKAAWGQTECIEPFWQIMDLDVDGLDEAIPKLLDGGAIRISHSTFPGDLQTIETMNQVLTLLVHLGYLAYDQDKEFVFLSGFALYRRFLNALKRSRRHRDLYRKERDSMLLLDAILQGDNDTVADLMDKAHSRCAKHRVYNTGDTLDLTIRKALSASRFLYQPPKEIPTCEYAADLLYLPKPDTCSPALVVELRWLVDDAVLPQILSGKYPEALQGYSGPILLVEVVFTSTHTCSIRTSTI